MKLKITRAKLLNGINAVAGINKGVQMQVLRNMRLDALAGYLSLTTTNLDLQVVFRTKAEVEDAGDILMDSAFFARFVTAMPEGVVTIEAEKDKMAHITGGEVNYHLATDDPANFPAMATADTDDKDKTLFIPCMTLAEMIRKVRFAASTDETRRSLMGVNLKHADGRLVATATSGRSLATVNYGTNGGEDFEATIPSASVAILSRLLAKTEDVGDCGIRMSGPVVRFVTDDWCVTTKRIDDAYPNWKRVVPESNSKSATFNRATFLLELQRAAAATAGEQLGVSVTFANGKITFDAKSQQTRAKIDMVAKYEGETVTFHLDPALLAPALDCIEENEMTAEFNDGSSAIVLVCSIPWLAVIMPLRKI